MSSSPRRACSIVFAISPLILICALVLAAAAPALADKTLGKGVVREAPDYNGQTNYLQAPGFVGKGSQSADKALNFDTNPYSTNHWLNNFLWAKGAKTVVTHDDANNIDKMVCADCVNAWKYISDSSTVTCNGNPINCVDVSKHKGFAPSPLTQEAPVYVWPYALKYSTKFDQPGNCGLMIQTVQPEVINDGNFGSLANQRKIYSSFDTGELAVQMFAKPDYKGADLPDVKPTYVKTMAVQDFSASFRMQDETAAGKPSLDFTVVKGSPLIYFQANGVGKIRLRSLGGADANSTDSLIDKPKPGEFFGSVDPGANLKCVLATIRTYGQNSQPSTKAKVVRRRSNYAVFYDPASAEVYVPCVPKGLNGPELPYIELRAKGGKTGSFAFTVACLPAGASPADQNDVVPLASIPGDGDCANPNQPADYTKLANAAAISAAKALAPYALGTVTGTQISYVYNQDAGTVTTTFTAVSNGQGAVFGLFPHQYQDFSTGTNKITTLTTSAKDLGLSFATVRGGLKLYGGTSFTTTYRYPGILPWLPKPATYTPPKGDETPDKFLTVEQADMANWKPPYTNYKNKGGYDTYNMGKMLARSAQLLSYIKDYGGKDGDNLLATLKKTLEQYFTAGDLQPSDPTPPLTCCPNVPAYKTPIHYQSWYNADAKSLILLPAGNVPNGLFPINDADKTAASGGDVFPFEGYGNATLLNDHHFTYGYFIYAAAQIAMWDKDQAWASEAQFRKAVNELVYDIAYDPDKSKDKAAFVYPKMRMFDQYEGHGWSGLNPGTDQSGNNEESISEEINAWSAIALWGSATGQNELRDLGVYLFTTAVHSGETYWYDRFGMYAAMGATRPDGTAVTPAYGVGTGNGAKQPFVARVFQGYVAPTTFFNTHPLAEKTIILFPFFAHSLYLARLGNSYLTTFYTDLKKFMHDNNISPWDASNLANFSANCGGYSSVFAKFVALSDPAEARKTVFPWKSTDTKDATKNFHNFVDSGDTATNTLHTIQMLDALGPPQFDFTANQPHFAVFKKGDVYTFVGYNPPSATGPVDIVFTGPQAHTIKGVKPGELRVEPPQANL